jgi:hypothetical protein
MSPFYRPPSARSIRPSRRRSGRTALIGVGLLAAGAAALLGGGLFLRLHPRFAVRRVVLEGVPDSRRAEAEELTDAWIGQPLLFTDVDRPVALLSVRPWVESAAARRVVPDTIVVHVVARPPVALARRSGELWAVDGVGGWLWPYTGHAVAKDDDFVLLDPGGDLGLLPKGTAFLKALAADDSSLLSRVSEIEVSPDGFALVDRVARARLLFGPDALEPGRASASWRAYLALRPELARHGLLTAEADLRFADRIVINTPPSESGRGKT